MSNKGINHKKSREIDGCLLQGESFYDACKNVLAGIKRSPSQGKSKKKVEDIKTFFSLLTELDDNHESDPSKAEDRMQESNSALDKLSQLYKKKRDVVVSDPKAGIDRYHRVCVECQRGGGKHIKQMCSLFDMLVEKGVDPSEARFLALEYSHLISNHK